MDMDMDIMDRTSAPSDPSVGLASTNPHPASPPRYLAETSRSRSEAVHKHRERGAALRAAALEQRANARNKARALLRQKSRIGAHVRMEHRQLSHAICERDSTYQQRARVQAEALRQLSGNIRTAKSELQSERRASAQQLRCDAKSEWERRRLLAAEARRDQAKCMHDEIRRSRLRVIIPPELDEQMRRFGIGPYAGAVPSLRIGLADDTLRGGLNFDAPPTDAQEQRFDA